MKFTLALMVAALATAAAFNGEATYYSGAGKGGACTSDYVPAGFKTVALNAPQYAGGAMCGACISLTFNDPAVGTVSVNAIVDNLCPECKHGDLDMGWGGNGRWPLTWQFIDCPATELMFSTQGSNNFYGKMKIEGGGPVASASCNGIPAQMTPDGYCVWSDGSGSLGCGPTCTINFSNGKSVTKQVDGGLFGGGCNGKAPANVQAPAPVAAAAKAPQAVAAPAPQAPAPQAAAAAPAAPQADAQAPPQCAGISGQCGGDGFNGDTCCADDGADCVWVNPGWSECKWPAPAAPETAQKVEQPAPAEKVWSPESDDNSCANGTGILSGDKLSCCMASCGKCGGSKCSLRDGKASGCCQRNIKLANKTCEETGGKAPCLMKRVVQAAAAAPAPAAKDSSSSGPDCVAKNWAQCGGEGYSGCTKCGEGFHCKDHSWNWHQCVDN